MKINYLILSVLLICNPTGCSTHVPLASTRGDYSSTRGGRLPCEMFHVEHSYYHHYISGFDPIGHSRHSNLPPKVYRPSFSPRKPHFNQYPRSSQNCHKQPYLYQNLWLIPASQHPGRISVVFHNADFAVDEDVPTRRTFRCSTLAPLDKFVPRGTNLYFMGWNNPAIYISHLGHSDLGANPNAI